MENRSKIIVIFIVVSLGFAIYFSGLTDVLCGGLTPDLEHKIAAGTKLYGNDVDIEVIPCENNYINIRIKNEAYTVSLFDSLHEHLYDKKTKSGWGTLVIFDNKGQYIFSHYKNNKVYRQTGD